MNTQAEILAPAGSPDALKAAVQCGADAVYLGAPDFNARRGAHNFTAEELEQAIAYCHVRGVKVHLALNTLVSDAELPRALSVIECGCTLGADAFIIQDLGIARLCREVCPDMPLHASTQMAVMTPAGFRELERLGFSRAVLPRELSLEEIREIRKATNIELEAFVHGALCMCVSGQCYLSAMLGGRSGNRGLCAQPCRLPFSADETGDHALSLKDLDLIPCLGELQDAGVCSFKIEGRMKRPEYVAAAVTACKNAIHNTPDPELSRDLQSVFSRSGFTDGYYKDRRGPDMFGTRRKDDVTAAAPVLKRLQGLYNQDAREDGPTPVDFHFVAHVGSPAVLTATARGISASAQSDDSVQKAQTRATEEDAVSRQLQKTGGTPFHVNELGIELGDDVFLPASTLNKLRRDALAKLEAELPKASVKAVQHVELPPISASKGRPLTGLILRVDTAEQLPNGLTPSTVRNLVVPYTTPLQTISALSFVGFTIGIEIPRGLYGDLTKLEEELQTGIVAGATFLYAGTLDGIALAQKLGLPMLGGPTLNAYNARSVGEYRGLGVDTVCLSMELTTEEICGLRQNAGPGLAILAYGRPPLMLTRNAPRGLSAENTGDFETLADRKDISFPVKRQYGASELYNSRPIWMADRLRELPEDLALLLYCTTETREQVQEVLDGYKNQTAAPMDDFTRGLYYRGVK